MPKLSGLTVCVNRSHHLALTLKHNAALLDELVVVTHPDDVDTIKTACRCEFAKVIFSRRCYEDDAAFNMGKMQNDGFKYLANPEWITFFACDVFLNPNVRILVDTLLALNPELLYTGPRINTDETNAHFPETEEVAKNMGGMHETLRQPNGFFQLFNRKAKAIENRPLLCFMSESFCNAAGVDSWFAQQWSIKQWRCLPELACLHINHGVNAKDNLNGTARTGPQWRQCACINGDGIWIDCTSPWALWLRGERLPDGPVRIRLTETRDGEQIELNLNGSDEIPREVLKTNRQGLVFRGREIGMNHVHVAYYREDKREIQTG